MISMYLHVREIHEAPTKQIEEKFEILGKWSDFQKLRTIVLSENQTKNVTNIPITLEIIEEIENKMIEHLFSPSNSPIMFDLSSPITKMCVYTLSAINCAYESIIDDNKQVYYSEWKN